MDSRGAESLQQIWPLWWCISSSIRVPTMLNHIWFVFTTIGTSKKNFFQSVSWKRHRMTHWYERRCLDSYWQWQTSQSYCEISSNCGKNLFTSVYNVMENVLDHVQLAKIWKKKENGITWLYCKCLLDEPWVPDHLNYVARLNVISLRPRNDDCCSHGCSTRTFIQ